MSNINKILLVVFGVIVLFFILNLTQNKSSKPTTQNNSAKNTSIVSQEGKLSSQENEGGNVTVTIKAKILKVGEKPTFDAEFSTHSVDLDFDIPQISSLTNDQGSVLTMPKWDGTGPGGHHRSGTLIFSPTLSETKYVELVIKDVAGVKERKFRWNL